jgi:hypothetical protein
MINEENRPIEMKITIEDVIYTGGIPGVDNEGGKAGPGRSTREAATYENDITTWWLVKNIIKTMFRRKRLDKR